MRNGSNFVACAFISAFVGCGGGSHTVIEFERAHLPFQDVANLCLTDLAELLGDDPEKAFCLGDCAYRPLRIWVFEKPERERFFVVLQADHAPHPGSTHVRMTVIADDGKVLSASKFTTGHRAYLREAYTEHVGKGEYNPFEEHEYPLVALDARTRHGPGPDYARQYYALIGNTFHLVRLEDFAGKATRNLYLDPDRACGPPVQWRTEAEFEAELLSDDRWRLLRCLVWLGGKHDDPQSEWGEDQDLVRLFHKLISRGDIVERLKSLLKHEDPWVREAAGLAADPKHGQ